MHSGDATLVLPVQRLSVGTVRAVKCIACDIARALRVDGPVNLQFLAIDYKDAIVAGEVSLLINIPEGTTRSDEITAGYRMRRAAVDYGTALIGNLQCALLFAEALNRNRPLPCKSVEEYLRHKLTGRTVRSGESAWDGLVG